MQLEPIRYLDFAETDRKEVQDRVIADTQARPEVLIAQYTADPRSFQGRYIAADLFKEQFPEFSRSAESRNRYNNAVHNSAAVLSSAMFRERLLAAKEPTVDTVYFVTGPPGAGKTSMFMEENALPSNAHLVFEGQMVKFETSADKIQRALDAGFRPIIVVVHPKAENALDNTLARFETLGRGSSLETIAGIQGGLPDNLQKLGIQYGDNLSLLIYDVRDRANPQTLTGFEHVDVLRSEGNYDQIKRQLGQRILALRASGRISESAYRQAAGERPLDRAQVEREREVEHQTIVRGPGKTQGNRSQAVLNEANHQSSENGDSVDAAAKATKKAELSHLRITDAEPAVSVKGTVVSIDEKHVIVQNGKDTGVRFPKELLRMDVKDGQNVELRFRGADQSAERSPARAKELTRAVRNNDITNT